MSMFLFSQEKLIERRELRSNEIEIITDGLDDIILENSKNNLIEVILLDENPNTHSIFLKKEIGVLNVKFELNFNTSHQKVFRKFITKRLHRAKAIIKIPVNKNVIIHGRTIGVVSKSYQGNIKIYIDKGNVRLNEVKGNVLVKLFLGNVYAQLNKNINLDIETTKGEIVLNSRNIVNQYYKKKETSGFTFKVKSINANVILITE